MLKNALLLVILFLRQICYAQNINEKLSKIDSVLENVHRQTHIGFAIGIVIKDSLIYSKGFGYADREKQLGITPYTVFQIGSISKTFTSSLIGLLEKKNLIDINDPAVKYHSQLEFFSKELNRTITIKDMLCHHTTVAPYDLSWYLFPTDNISYLTRMKYMQSSQQIEDFNYNNNMYFLLGEIAQNVCGKSFETLLEEKIWKPLSFKNTFITHQGAPTIAKGYIYENNQFNEEQPVNITTMQAAGGIYSNVTDLSKWIAVWINEGKYHNKLLLPTQYIKKAISPWNAVMRYPFYTAYDDIYSLWYGLGWFVTSYRGHYMCYHSGNISGYSSNISFFPKDKIGIVILSNQDKTNLPEYLSRAIADILFNLSNRQWESSISRNTGVDNKKFDFSTDTVKYAFGEDIAGTYCCKAFGDVIISKNESYFTLSTPRAIYRLVLVHGDYFKLVESETGKEKFHLIFIRNAENEVEKCLINFEPTLNDIAFTKKDNIPISNFTGQYGTSKASLKISLTEDNDLELNLPGRPVMLLKQVSPKKYQIEGGNGYFIKFITEGDSVKALKIIEPTKEIQFLKI